MIKITVHENRSMKIESHNIGVIGENNAETLEFVFPKSICGYDISTLQKRLVIVNQSGSFANEITANSDNRYLFDIPFYITADEKIKFQIKMYKYDNEIIWKSYVDSLTFFSAIDDSGINLIDNVKADQKEKDRVELAEALEACDIRNEIDPPTDFQSRDWENLLVIVEETDYLTLDDTNKLIELNTIKAKAAETNLDNPIESIDFWRCIEAQTAADTQYITAISRLNLTVPTRIPRLDTAHITGYDTDDGTGTLTGGLAYLSSKIVSFDIDVSGLGANGLSYNGNTFIGGYRAMQGANNLLESATFRGCQNIKNLFKVFYGSANIKTVEFQNLETLTSISEAFRGCTNLETIAGSELNLTGLAANALGNAFVGCASLKEVRFKLNTISANISFFDCYQLSKESTLSLINGLIAGTNCTVSLNTMQKVMCGISYAYESDGIWIDCERTQEGAETYSAIITDYKGWSIG